MESLIGKLGYSADAPVKARVLFDGKPLSGIKVDAASTTPEPGRTAGDRGGNRRGRTGLPRAPRTRHLDLERDAQVRLRPGRPESLRRRVPCRNLAIPVAEEK